MRVLQARIEGFQSFKDSGNIEFQEGVNLIVGQNNVGKSSILRALQSHLGNDRHKSPAGWLDNALPNPQVILKLSVRGSEIREAVFIGNSGIYIPTPQNVNGVEFASSFLDGNDINVSVINKAGNGNFFPIKYPSHELFDDSGDNNNTVIISPQNGSLSVQNYGNSREDSIASAAKIIWDNRMFYFAAERMNIGVSPAEYAYKLSPNAQNLPSVLFTLNGERGDIFSKLVGHLREVFSTLGNVSVRPAGGGQVEVRVWPTEAMERVELSFPLLHSGTGVSQVISILTAVMTMEKSVIIIDEINSFLHPAAVKTLLRILQTEYSDHQYIISTHSPEVINFSNPRTVHLVKRIDYESIVSRLDMGKVDDFREVAEHLGVSMADVFAADRIIWVEGPTEELCFPLLYKHVSGQTLPRGTIFTSVMATGDFMAKRRDKELVYQIYKRLSQVAVPLVVSVAFSFDSENLKDEEKASMVQDSQGTMHFLPRRHIECYLVNAVAIANFIAERDFNAGGFTEAAVAAKLTELAAAESFAIPEWNGDLADVAWLAKVDAANLIAKTCSEISDQRVTFNKKDDTLWLCQRVQVEAPGQLQELCEYVRTLVEAVS